MFDFRTGDRYKRKVLTPKEFREKGGFLPGYNLKDSFRTYDKDSWRALTAKAIKGYSNPSSDGTGIDSLPDILALEEVDSMDALRLFNEKYLGNYYDHAILIDGNDIRRIDVGLLSKFKIKSTSTNIYEPYKNAEGSSSSGNTTGISKRRYLFSRDCLITEMEIPGNQKTLTTNPDRLYSPKSTSCQEFNRRTIH